MSAGLLIVEGSQYSRSAITASMEQRRSLHYRLGILRLWMAKLARKDTMSPRRSMDVDVCNEHVQLTNLNRQNLCQSQPRRDHDTDLNDSSLPGMSSMH